MIDVLQAATLEETPSVLVRGQVSMAMLEAAKDAGVASVLNHRPDGEEPGQVASSDLEAAALALGLRYRHLPVRGYPDEAVVAATAQALGDLAEGEAMLMFCKSGMRSAVAWALARSSMGADPDTLRQQAAAAGFDLSRLPL